MSGTITCRLRLTLQNTGRANRTRREREHGDFAGFSPWPTKRQTSS